MQQQESSVVNDIVQYIRRTNTPLTEWYVGIAGDAQARLFKGHGVNKDRDYWIYRECLSPDAARRVEQYVITNYQTDGGSGGGSDASRFVYAYKKERHTRERIINHGMFCCAGIIGFFITFCFSIVFPDHVLAATVTPVSVNTISPVIGNSFSVTASVSGALAGNIYFLKCRIGASSSSLTDGQTFNPQTSKWLDDTGSTGAWIDMPQVTIGADGTWQEALQCRMKNGAVDESKVLFLRACLNANSSCGTSFQSNSSLALNPIVPTPTPTPMPTPTSTPSPTPTPTPTPESTKTPTPTSTSTPTPTPTPAPLAQDAEITDPPEHANETVPIGLQFDELVRGAATDASGGDTGRNSDMIASDDARIYPAKSLAISFVSIGLGLALLALVTLWQAQGKL